MSEVITRKLELNEVVEQLFQYCEANHLEGVISSSNYVCPSCKAQIAFIQEKRREAVRLLGDDK